MPGGLSAQLLVKPLNAGDLDECTAFSGPPQSLAGPACNERSVRGTSTFVQGRSSYKLQHLPVGPPLTGRVAAVRRAAEEAQHVQAEAVRAVE